ncbi:hypothetical protein [Clostridium aminobutyricum]|uniref:Ada DNA repair metal-binding domain-containing protein n=1 Tax=Clostridium aminobutyricum TaxID=33953 RepID=A0A939IIA4_CLOAM|nr:hypothetical protein [Clostridium aminobutyricum]MBN7772363.1 hypothetical protein [Clostridium aminobutyricum]
MDSLFFLLSFLCFICLVIGVFRPRTVIRWGLDEQKTKKNVMKYYGIGMILFLILFSINVDDSSVEKSNLNTEISSVEQTVNADEKIASNIEKKIEDLRNAESITLDKAVSVMEARILYDALTADQKELVSNLNVLTNAENKIEVLETEAAKQAVAQEQAQIKSEVQATASSQADKEIVTLQPQAQTQTNEYTVYITRTGEKYHRSGCRYLKQSQISISKSDAINQGYTPCSVCNP